jgi:hypothetical protein
LTASLGQFQEMTDATARIHRGARERGCGHIAARGARAAAGAAGYRVQADVSADIVCRFRQGLSEAGYVEGRNVTVEYHLLEGQYDRHCASGSGGPN